MNKVSIVIPAFNEAASVPSTVTRLRPVLDALSQEYTVEVILVDDGSRDDTVALLDSAFGADSRVRRVSHEVNRGLGAALRTGFSHASGDLIVTTDFDGTYAFDLIPHIIRTLIETQVDIVTASPYHPQGGVEGVPRYRLLFSFGASLLYRLLVRWRIHTWTALFRVYRAPVIHTITFESDDFLAGTELLVKALQAGYSVAEFPTVLRQRQFGQSSIRIARVTWAHLKFQFSILRRRLLPRRDLSPAPVGSTNRE